MVCVLILSAALLFVLLQSNAAVSSEVNDTAFGENYNISWREDHVASLYKGEEIQLILDKTSGSGFQSKLSYGSGLFHMYIKVPSGDTAGIVTAFYLSSQSSGHDELDFEFLGNLEGKRVALQTNVFVNGRGNREEKIHLWFDPAKDFHSYKILWNGHLIAFFVDDIPIRVYSNRSNNGVVAYPKKPMKVMASIWNGETWATNGGKDKINWRFAPFVSTFKGFNIDGCTTDDDSVPAGKSECYAGKDWWNSGNFTALTKKQTMDYQNVRKKYMFYDYCSDRRRYPVRPLECSGLQ